MCRLCTGGIQPPAISRLPVGHDEPNRPLLCSDVVLGHVGGSRVGCLLGGRRRTWRATALRCLLAPRARPATLAGAPYQGGYAACPILGSAWRSATGAWIGRSKRSRRCGKSLFVQLPSWHVSSGEGVIRRRSHMLTVARQVAARGRHHELRRVRPLLHQDDVFFVWRASGLDRAGR